MSQNANKDQNSVPTLICPLLSNAKSIVRILASNHALKVKEDSTTVAFPTNAPKDENSISCLLATSDSSNTPVVIGATINGELLIKIII